MIRYWGEFTKTLAPTVSGQATWPRLAATAGEFLALRPGGASQKVTLTQFDQQHQCDFWTRMPLVLDRGEI